MARPHRHLSLSSGGTRDWSPCVIPTFWPSHCPPLHRPEGAAALGVPRDGSTGGAGEEHPGSLGTGECPAWPWVGVEQVPPHLRWGWVRLWLTVGWPWGRAHLQSWEKPPVLS